MSETSFLLLCSMSSLRSQLLYSSFWRHDMSDDALSLSSHPANQPCITHIFLNDQKFNEHPQVEGH